ncbi:MAG: hypothetical protein LBT63_02180 [Holosporaceae bacterium]|nr:hypothetical protein [Holosporaceae bacterium]
MKKILSVLLLLGLCEESCARSAELGGSFANSNRGAISIQPMISFVVKVENVSNLPVEAAISFVNSEGVKVDGFSIAEGVNLAPGETKYKEFLWYGNDEFDKDPLQNQTFFIKITHSDGRRTVIPLEYDARNAQSSGKRSSAKKNPKTAAHLLY